MEGIFSNALLSETAKGMLFQDTVLGAGTPMKYGTQILIILKFD